MSKVPDPLKRAGRLPRMWTTDYGDPAFDFANTRFHRLTAAPAESLATPRDFLAWLTWKGLLDPAGYRDWSLYFERHPKQAWTTLRQAQGLREALYGVFLNLARRRRPRKADLDTLNRVLRDGRHYVLLAMRPPLDFELARRTEGTIAARLLAPITLSAAAALSGGHLRRIRQCLNDECSLLFFDQSRNGTRQWCDMALCGSILKMRRYRARRRSQQ